MFKDTVSAVRDEVIRLLSQQRNIISDLLESEDMVMERDEQQERSLDRPLAEMWNAALAEELTKVHDLEMTLAVVGTMKAGKSTTINAIVGREVLPNRNRPMTTLPTMIRHQPGQETPVLRFPKPQPFNQAIREIRSALRDMDEEALSSLPVNASDDGRTLVQDILSGHIHELDSAYHGTEGIYDFLKTLNDISRLCDSKNLDLPSPLTEYTSLLELPVIDVEFFHLKHRKQQTNGRLTLIDTPGPNEAGQVHLRGILQEQLHKASAILAVLDYTQLNSEADFEVRMAIEEVAKYSRERLFVLINKFDQKDRNSMGADEVRRYVSKELFEDRLPQEHIFPVSSQLGYLANYALREIAERGCLPSPDQAEWIEDFGDRALGSFWQEDIDDIPRVNKSAERLWQKSDFEEPLDRVIGKAYEEAALIVIQSALEKMNMYDEEILQYLKMRRGSIHIDIDSLKQIITELEHNIQLIQDVQEKAEALSDSAQKELSGTFDLVFNQGNETLKRLIDSLFRHGKRLESERAKLERKNNKKNKGYMSDIISLFKPAQKASIPINESGLNVFSNKQDALEFLNKIQSALVQDSSQIFKQIQSEVNRFVESMEYKLQSEIRDKMEPVLERAASKLNDTFHLKISFKQHAIKPIQINFESLREDSINVKNVEKKKTRYVRKWYTLWLREHTESYTVHEDEYHIDTKRMGAAVLENLKASQKKLQQDLDIYMNQELSNNLADYFNHLTSYLDKFLGNLMDGIHDKQKSEESLGKLLSAMESLISVVELHQQDIEPIMNEILSGNPVGKEVSLV
ncbi:dynamin family protein [Paenibacillus lemnae]|uniref:Dynamin-type G domain-containing protein n=1 Tax=Paenibacillus lemnae TaxID=1330551 RepID=A0A848M275_PAELE|nr:dynamin family protein [Paenibacillus lemnae]NMO94987.1 hypothetical protein [Paenibacillus lemnae]